VWYADGGPAGPAWDIFLDEAAVAGYTALELGPDGYLPSDSGRLREELARRGFSACAGTACYQFDKYRDFSALRPQTEALCRRIVSADAKFLVVMDESDVGEYSEKKKDFSPAVWRNYFAMIRELGIYTSNEFGVETVFHPHIKTLIETEEEILRMIDACNVNLCFDTGHHVYVNGGVEQGDKSAIDFIRKYPARVRYLHFKNVDGAVIKKVRAENLSSDTAFDLDVMCDLERGIIDFVELKETLDDIGYAGIGVIEMDMPRAKSGQAFAAGKRNLAYLRTIGVF
jgi:inosose dehydratase